MSSYSVSPVNDSHEILAGWDPMLNSFFAHVIDKTKFEDDLGRDVLWLGNKPDQIHDADVIIRALLPYAEYDGDELVTNLYRDANK